MIDKRKTPTMSDQEMYKISDINTFIEKEQRKDELDRLYEVRIQKRTWLKTVLFCLFLNLIFVALGVAGIIYN